MIELIIMSLLVILSVEASPGKNEPHTETDSFTLNTGEAVKSAGAHDKGSWYSDMTTPI